MRCLPGFCLQGQPRASGLYQAGFHLDSAKRMISHLSYARKGFSAFGKS